MIGKLVGNVAAVAVVLGWLSTAGVADAAKKKAAANGGGGAAVSGTVVRARNGKPVGHAHVRVASAHHHKHHKHVKATASFKKAKNHLARAHVAHHNARHASATTGRGGHFTVHTGGGAVTLVAHKRGVGTGRVHTVAGGGNVVIALHKRHHAHSGAITAHVRHAVQHRVAHKKAAKGKATPQKKNGK